MSTFNIDRQFFKNDRVYERAKLMHPTAISLLAEMIERIYEDFGIEPVVTETVTTLAEDAALKRVSATHREGRAFDIRSRGWQPEMIEAFIEHFEKQDGEMGAVSAKTGRPDLIVHHDTGSGPHFHVQLNRSYARQINIEPIPSLEEVELGNG